MIKDLDDLFHMNLGYYLSQISYEEDNERDVIDCSKAAIVAWECNTVKSPIEKRLFAHILFMSDGYWNVKYCLPTNPDDIEDATFYVATQYRIGRYKADFAFIFKNREHKKIIVVECDGHDFHEKTKEQAAHDKKRDRYFVSEGITTLRFTGSEIYNKCEDCIEEIQKELMKIKDKLWVDVEMDRLHG